MDVRAATCVLDIKRDSTLENVSATNQPWLLCYQAMALRLDGDFVLAQNLAGQAAALFAQAQDSDGQARAVAEQAIARYHLGQFAQALAELGRCPPPSNSTCAAALQFAAYLNLLGQDALDGALDAGRQACARIANEPNIQRRTTWQIVISRNLAAALHCAGELAAARQAAESAVNLAETQVPGSLVLAWCLYELGVLEQRAGQLARALDLLDRAHNLADQHAERGTLGRWTLAAQGQTLRDMGRLDQAEAYLARGGWGEDDGGPLMLWLLQGRQSEARLAAEARLVAAHASAAPIVATNLHVLLTLLEFEDGATAEVYDALSSAAERYAALGFRHNQASVLLHAAAAALEIGAEKQADTQLATALDFAATRGYHNFNWWHPSRMRQLLARAIKRGIQPTYCAALRYVRGLDQQPQLALVCLGRFEARLDGVVLEAKRWRGRAGTVRMQRMLLFLARNRSPQPLDVIARYVWPDNHEQISITNNFHLTLAELRRALEPQLASGSESRFILTTPEGYQLAPDVVAEVDLDRLLATSEAGRRAEASGDHTAAHAAFALVEQLYTGNFALSKPDPVEADGYRQRFHEALLWLAASNLSQGQLEYCITRARQLLNDEPWNSPAPALLIQAYLARGDRRAARRQYQRFLQRHGAASVEIAQLAHEFYL
ncbi:MAG: tetratricopeptide repeat protein [Roseiflexaceae bacterium]|nr:tetratricopeptide repeat protein [Roseiflexaceae bacterium]